MTTLAIRDGIIAADSRATVSSVIVPEAIRKLIVSQRHGVVYGVCGALADALDVVRGMESLSALPWISGEVFRFSGCDDILILVAQWDGRIFSIENGAWRQVTAEFIAGGSGMEAAYAAMHMGASATKAIEIASLCDSATGGDIAHFDIRNLEAPSKAKKSKAKKRR
jgi:ATP-dependent protease HslVU (ClpYQ) peptidase subunit